MTPQQINTERQKLMDAVNVAKTAAELQFLKENCYTVEVELYDMFGQAEPYIKPVGCPHNCSKCNDCAWCISKKFSIKKVFCMRGDEYVEPGSHKELPKITDSLMNRKKYSPNAKLKKAMKEEGEL